MVTASGVQKKSRAVIVTLAAARAVVPSPPAPRPATTPAAATVASTIAAHRRARRGTALMLPPLPVSLPLAKTQSSNLRQGPRSVKNPQKSSPI
jgi:hypothetical protein